VLTIVHGSDLHFGKPHRAEAAEAFAETVRSVAPDLLVISGDLTQRAKVSEFEQARAYLDRFEDIPTVVTPGNHDVPLYRVFERLVDPYRNYRRHLEDRLDYTLDLPGARVVSLNSAAPRARIVNGTIRKPQLEFARRSFEEARPEQARIVVLHHHIASAPDYEGDRPLVGARKVLEALDAMGVELILSGHLHRAYIGNSRDVFPSAARDGGITIVHSGTTTSWRGRAREQAQNTCNRIRVGDHVVEVTHLLFIPEEGRFSPISRHEFPRRHLGILAPDVEASLLRLPREGEAEG
jgi:3',5'-cyclic AMP phosphodiesterase CpdA